MDPLERVAPAEARAACCADEEDGVEVWELESLGIAYSSEARGLRVVAVHQLRDAEYLGRRLLRVRERHGLLVGSGGSLFVRLSLLDRGEAAAAVLQQEELDGQPLRAELRGLHPLEGDVGLLDVSQVERHHRAVDVPDPQPLAGERQVRLLRSVLLVGPEPIHAGVRGARDAGPDAFEVVLCDHAATEAGLVVNAVIGRRALELTAELPEPVGRRGELADEPRGGHRHLGEVRPRIGRLVGLGDDGGRERAA